MVYLQVRRYELFRLWLKQVHHGGCKTREGIPDGFDTPMVNRWSSSLLVLAEGPTYAQHRQEPGLHHLVMSNFQLKILIGLVHKLPEESVGSERFEPNHVGLLILNGVLNIISDQPQVLPLFKIVFGLFLVFEVNFLLSLGSLLHSLMVHLVELLSGEAFEVPPDCRVLHVVMDEVSFLKESFAFVFELGVFSSVDEIKGHFLVVDHLFDLELDSLLMLDGVSRSCI